MSVPVVCPHCYKNIQTPGAGSDGLVHCDACGHAFPATGAPAATSAPAAYKPLPSYQPSYSTSTTTPSPGKYQPVYPPASGPQNAGNPGLVACGMIAMFGVMGLLCCGALGFVVYGLGNQKLANQAANPPAINPPNLGPPNLNPQNFNQPNFNPPIGPQLEADNPFESVVPPPASVPGIQTMPAPKTLDDFLQAMQTIDTTGFTARTMLEEFNTLPVEEGRRTEVVDAVLQLLGRAGVHARWVLAGPGETTLEVWTSKEQATNVARFAAGDANHHARHHLLKVLAKVGGDAETAKALLPLVKDPVSSFTLPDVFARIGPDAEEVLLSQIDTEDITARRALYSSLAKVGGKKSAERLQAKINSGEGFDRVFGAQALNEIKSRESNKK
jgi:hypothetical protein